MLIIISCIGSYNDIMAYYFNDITGSHFLVVKHYDFKLEQFTYIATYIAMALTQLPITEWVLLQLMLKLVKVTANN